MPWIYRQRTGELLRDQTYVATGYAGRDKGKNNPLMQDVPNTGPLPCGWYTLEAPVDTKTHGPYVLWLEPDKENQMFGRSAFGIHGDSVRDPGTASEGCMIFPRWARQKMWESGDHRLQVISGVL